MPEFVYVFLIQLYQPPICNKYSMEQIGEEVKQTGNGDKAHGKQETLAPGIEIKDKPVSCIKAIVPCHLEIFFGDVLDKQLNKIDRRKSFSDERIIFMPVVMKGHIIPVIRINPGKGNGRAAKVAADIFDNRFEVAEVWFCVNIKAIFVFMVYFRCYKNLKKELHMEGNHGILIP